MLPAGRTLTRQPQPQPQVSRVPQNVYAALIGRPADVELRTLVKRGAWYSHVVRTTRFFGERLHGRGGRYGGNGDLATGSKMELKYQPATRTISVGVEVGHSQIFAYEDDEADEAEGGGDELF